MDTLPIYTLPIEILYNIIGFIGFKDLINLGKVNRYYRFIVNDIIDNHQVKISVYNELVKTTEYIGCISIGNNNVVQKYILRSLYDNLIIPLPDTYDIKQSSIFILEEPILTPYIRLNNKRIVKYLLFTGVYIDSTNLLIFKIIDRWLKTCGKNIIEIIKDDPLQNKINNNLEYYFFSPLREAFITCNREMIELIIEELIKRKDIFSKFDINIMNHVKKQLDYMFTTTGHYNLTNNHNKYNGILFCGAIDSDIFVENDGFMIDNQIICSSTKILSSIMYMVYD